MTLRYACVVPVAKVRTSWRVSALPFSSLCSPLHVLPADIPALGDPLFSCVQVPSEPTTGSLLSLPQFST